MKVVDVKLRRIGTSVGVLIPKEVLDEGHYKVGDKIELTIWKRPSKQEIARAFGSMPRLGPFKREKKDRYDKY